MFEFRSSFTPQTEGNKTVSKIFKTTAHTSVFLFTPSMEPWISLFSGKCKHRETADTMLAMSIVTRHDNER